jgi:hypothetical protein
MTESIKRANFKQLDYELLISLIEEHKDVITERKYDSISLAKKSKVWDEISKQFNERNPLEPKTIQQLKKCWENLQNKSKRAAVDEKISRRKTGGGIIDIEATDLESKVNAIMGDELKPLQNPYGSDSKYHENNVITIDETEPPLKTTKLSSNVKNETTNIESQKCGQIRDEAQKLMVEKLRIEIRILEKKEIIMDSKVELINQMKSYYAKKLEVLNNNISSAIITFENNSVV